VYCNDDSRPTQNVDDESDDQDRSKYSTADVHVCLLQKSTAIVKHADHQASARYRTHRLIADRRAALHLAHRIKDPLLGKSPCRSVVYRTDQSTAARHAVTSWIRSPYNSRSGPSGLISPCHATQSDRTMALPSWRRCSSRLLRQLRPRGRRPACPQRMRRNGFSPRMHWISPLRERDW